MALLSLALLKPHPAPADAASTHSARSARSALRARLSRLTTFRRQSKGLAHIAQVYEGSSARTPSPEPSLEIRRPSGLGRRVSLEGWLAAAEENSEGSEVWRRKSKSTPELVLVEGAWEARSGTTLGGEVQLRLPEEVLRRVVSLAEEREVGVLARTCRVLCAAARVRLYRALALRPEDACVGVLARSRDVAGVVESLEVAEMPREGLPAVTLAIALSNMHALTRLVLPRFDAALLFHTTFRLRDLTLLCTSAPQPELHDLFTWLADQPSLESLAFPNLRLDDSTSQWLSTPPPSPDSQPPSLFPPSLLPSLTSLTAPTPLTTALAPGRPLTHTTLLLSTTLYDGLKPNTLAGALAQSTRPLASLALHSAVDARTLERVLGALAAELPALSELVLAGAPTRVRVPRFRALRRLRLVRSGEEEVPDGAGEEKERVQLAAWARACATLEEVVFAPGGTWRIHPGAVFELLSPA